MGDSLYTPHIFHINLIMKNLILIIVLAICLNLVASNKQNQYSSSNSDLNYLYRTLSDSMISLIENKPMILYMCGHHAHVWSVIIINENKYQIVCGRGNSRGVNTIYKPIEPHLFDTTSFFSAHKEIISWGFDTMPYQAHRMKAIRSSEFILYNGNLSTISMDSTKSFNSNYAIAFSGPDSIEFNSKFHKLKEVMLWLAFPLIREYTPDSVFMIRKTNTRNYLQNYQFYD